MNSNPLIQYFRQPAIYIRLPSQGKFYPPGALDMPANGEIPVLPMTTLDEITYRTPDALFNGQAVVSVIQSCIPNIKDAWLIPATDIDTILVAIRIATYGHQLDVDTKCPQCDGENTFGVDLRRVLDSIQPSNYNETVKQGDLEIYFRPMTYSNINENSLAQFEEQKTLQMIDGESEQNPEVRSKQLSEVLRQITQVTIKALSQSIAAVKTPQGTVTDPMHISEWLSNCDRKVFSLVRDHIIKTKQGGEIPPLDCECGHCQHKYQQPITLNMSDFFEAAS